MKRYGITGLTVDINFKGELLNTRAKKYEIEYLNTQTADITIDIDPALIQKRVDLNPASTLVYGDYEYIMTGTKFYRGLLDFNGFMLHSSAVVLDGKAYLFSAPSGTGKSTHTELWTKYFKGKDVYIINDDKPALRLMDDGKFYVFGTPWSGKTDKNENARVPLQGICFIERSEENRIRKISNLEAVNKLMWQTIRPLDTQSLDKLLSLFDKLIEQTDMYLMGCSISNEAVELAYNTMK